MENLFQKYIAGLYSSHDLRREISTPNPRTFILGPASMSG